LALLGIAFAHGLGLGIGLNTPQIAVTIMLAIITAVVLRAVSKL